MFDDALQGFLAKGLEKTSAGLGSVCSVFAFI